VSPYQETQNADRKHG